MPFLMVVESAVSALIIPSSTDSLCFMYELHHHHVCQQDPEISWLYAMMHVHNQSTPSMLCMGTWPLQHMSTFLLHDCVDGCMIKHDRKQA